MLHGLVDGIFWSGVFAFVSASVNAIKAGVRSIQNAKLASNAQTGSQPCSTVNQCFIAGTLVACLDEEGNEITKPIEDIKIGDLVLAYDEKTGENTYKPVLHLFRNKSKEWTGVTVNGEEIISTPGHKYYLPNTKAWVSAEELEVGINVLLSNGEYGIIEAIRAIHYDTPQTTYNFEVADVHTYYVGTGVCVHNMGCQTQNQKALTKLIKENGKNRPLSIKDAETLVNWGKEYNMSIRIDMGHKIGSAVSRAPHLHTGFNNWHIPIIMD